MMLGVAGRRPKYWWDLGQGIDSDLGGLLGTFVRNSNGLYTDPTSGLITTVGNNIPRFERQGGHLAILDEPEGTNLIHFSHELGNDASGGWWIDAQLTSVTANGMLGPDGAMSADGLIATVVNDSHFIVTPLIVGIAKDDKIAITVFTKPGNKNWARLRTIFYDVGGNPIGDDGSYYFDISSGNIGTKVENGDVTIHGYLIEKAANGFYQIGIIISNADINTSKLTCNFYSAEDDLDHLFSGDALTVNTWFWEANLMKQDFFSSPVPTSGATASRATESGYSRYTLPAGLFDAQGTLSIWMYHGMAFGDYSAGDYGIVSLNGNAKSALYLDENGNVCTFDGTNETVHNVNWPINVWRKYVLTWDQAANAVQVGVDTGAGVALTGGVFDGAYDVAGGILSLSQGLLAPRHLRNFMIDDEVWSVSKINSFGSP